VPRLDLREVEDVVDEGQEMASRLENILLPFSTRPPVRAGSGSGPAYSRYFKQIAKAVVLPRP